MCDQFNNNGTPISKVYFSPYHPTEGIGEYKKDHLSRKPHPGMILQAQQDFNLDLNQSILIGDKRSDIQAGIAAGVKCNILFSEVRPADLSTMPCYWVTALTDAIPFLESSKTVELTQ